jgi:aspartyl-tRNA(Asn)/glutamyl-tRNA(Gln) amidotransferase subunit B
VLRSKEEAEHYRYMPEPDLPMFVIDQDWVEQVRKNLPELPREKRIRYQKEMGISHQDACTLTTSRQMAALFEKTATLCQNPREACHLIVGEVARLCTENSHPAGGFKDRCSKAGLLDWHDGVGTD